MPRNDLTELGKRLNLPQATAAENKKLRQKRKLEFTGNESVLEYRIKRLVKERLNEIGAYHFWPVQMGMGEACIDCVGCYNGRFFGIETKRPGAKPTLRQEGIMERMRAAGAEVFVIDSDEAAKNLFVEIV